MKTKYYLYSQKSVGERKKLDLGSKIQIKSRRLIKEAFVMDSQIFKIPETESTHMILANVPSDLKKILGVAWDNYFMVHDWGKLAAATKKES